MAIAKHKKFSGPDAPSWELTPRGDGYFRIQISRSTLVAFIASLLLHLLLLITLAPKLLNTKPITAEHQSLVIRLVPPNRAQAKTSPVPSIAATPKLATHQLHKASPALPSPPITKDEFAAPNNHAATSPNPSPPPTDMMAYVNAKRAHRETAEKLAGHENSIADPNEREPTEDEQRTATIKRNLQQGTNGLFQIISLSARSAEFSFRGWTNDLSYSKRQIIDVEAGPGVDIRRAVVRRMIELIRTYYSGDFNWESIRLNRVIVLSARVEDNAGLEDFLLSEFFGPAAGIPAN
ncbi:MAG TPA: hypothetical protein VIE91_02875 [Methylophilaceae bacterium]